MSRLPPALRTQLLDFLDEHNATRNIQQDWSFDLAGFLVEALVCAEDNEQATERAGHHDFPGLTCMLERLDEHLEIHKTHTTQQGPVVEWFDAP